MSDFTSILGIPFSRRTEAEAKQEILALLQGRRNARVFTPNPDILMKAKEDPALKDALLHATLLLPDGIGVILASRLTGAPLPQRITGIDTAEWLLSYAAQHGLSVYLLGGKEGVAEEAASRLLRRFPSLRIAGTHHGYFDKQRDSADNTALLRRISAASPDLLFVCFGCPAQEHWIVENTPSLPSLRLSMGLGGCLDVWSGQRKRAPRILRRMGMEWLWRALSEPRRLLPLLHTPRFLAASLLSSRRP